MSELLPIETHTCAFDSSGGEFRCWAAQGTSCMVKAITKFGDPVEFGSNELEIVIEGLKKILEEIR